MTIAQDIQKPFVSPYMQMFDIDGTTINGALRFYFTNSSDTPFTFDGISWQPFPIKITGNEITTDQPPRPKLYLSNVTKVIQPYMQAYQDLAGLKITLRQTLWKYTAGQPTADSSQELPREVYYIWALTSHTRDALEFDMTTVYDLPGVKLPRAQALKDQTNSRNMWAPGLSTVRFRG